MVKHECSHVLGAAKISSAVLLDGNRVGGRGVCPVMAIHLVRWNGQVG